MFPFIPEILTRLLCIKSSIITDMFIEMFNAAVNQFRKVMTRSSMIIIQSIVNVLSLYLPSLSVWARSWQDQTNNYEEELTRKWKSCCRFWFDCQLLINFSLQLTFKQETWEHQKVEHFVNWKLLQFEKHLGSLSARQLQNHFYISINYV